MLVLPALAGMAKVHQTNLLTNVGIRLKTAMTVLVFDKAVLLSAQGRGVCPKGEMINLVANDAEKVMMTAVKFNTFWSAPVTTAMCLALLSLEIGAGAAFAGFAMLWVGFILLGLIFANIGRLKREERKESDRRVTKMGELLRGIKILKLYCWEEPMAAQIDEIRKREVTTVKKQILLQAAMQITLTATPSIMALVAFKVYVGAGNKVTPAKIFTCLVLFELLRWALMQIPQIIIALVDIKVAKARYTKFLTAHEVDTSMHLTNDAGDTDAAVLVRECCFSWGDAVKPTLSDINLRVKARSLSLICGRVGSGKSSLISGLLDELRCTASSSKKAVAGSEFGYVVRGKVAYVAQEAFIQNLSVRENILFGAPFDQDRYNRVVEACSLKSDFAVMPSGDACEIGERGVNLSGGQKQRVAIARAVYSDASVFLFDDPLSAVDPEVANHIFSNVIEGMLKHKTVVLVTHALNFCPRADQIIFIDGGKIVACGTYAELMAADTEATASFAALIGEHGIGGSRCGRQDIDDRSAARSNADLAAVVLKEKAADGDAEDGPAVADGPGVPSESKTGKGLVEEEEVAQGKIGAEMYLYYFNEAGGCWVYSLLFFCVLAMQATMIGSEWWLGRWSLNAFDEVDAYYLRIYALILSGLGVIIATRIGVVYNRGLVAAQSLHNQLLARVLSATMTFMDATPIGRCAQHTSTDMLMLSSAKTC